MGNHSHYMYRNLSQAVKVFKTANEILFSFALGEVNNALGIFKEVYQGQKNSLGADHTDTLDSKYQIAFCFTDLG